MVATTAWTAIGALAGIQWVGPVLWVHILAGVVALFAGIVAIGTRKGGRRHNSAGKLYGLTMALVVLTAVPLSLVSDNWFLLAISVFSGYLVAAGYRVIRRRRKRLSDPTVTDHVLHGTMLLASVSMIVGGGVGAATGTMALGEVLVVFGIIGGALALRELRQLWRPTEDRMPWFSRHITFMGGAYIATVTATITVNLTMVPAVVRWLGPTVVGVPLIFYAIRQYRPRFGAAGA